jgi:transcriptional regulator with XRE-family HTH domain
MTTKAHRPTGDLRLKIAILETGRSQRRVAIDTRIGEVRLSKIIRGLQMPTPSERAKLAKYLDRPIAELFVLPDIVPLRPEGSKEAQGTGEAV